MPTSALRSLLTPLVVGVFVGTLLVGTAYFDSASHLGKTVACPTISGGFGEVYCEQVVVPEPLSGQPCAYGSEVSGTFHEVNFTFQRYDSCGPHLDYEMNCTIEELEKQPLMVHFDVVAPLFDEWNNYTTPDDRVMVTWFDLNQSVTLAVDP
jgi:hypothetical protein